MANSNTDYLAYINQMSNTDRLIFDLNYLNYELDRISKIIVNITDRFDCFSDDFNNTETIETKNKIQKMITDLQNKARDVGVYIDFYIKT